MYNDEYLKYHLPDLNNEKDLEVFAVPFC